MRSAGMSVGITAVQYTSNFIVTMRKLPVLLAFNVGLIYGLFAFAFLRVFLLRAEVHEGDQGRCPEDMEG